MKKQIMKKEELGTKKNIQSVFIEGNVGAGKSTLLRLIKDAYHVQAVNEPHHLWQDVEGENLLEKFFIDQKRWAYSLQSYVLFTRILQQKEADLKGNGDLQLIERSVYSGRFCFAKNCFEIGLINQLEWNLYKVYWDWFTKQYPKKPTAFIYMRTPYDICYKRIQKRQRHEEEPITLEYLKSLEEKHDDLFIHKNAKHLLLQDVPILTLDCSDEFVRNVEEQQEHFEAIMKFLKNNNISIAKSHE